MFYNIFKWLFSSVKECMKNKKLKEDYIFYIGGSEILPPPLSPSDEKQCIEALVSENSEEAQKTLISHNLRLVVYLARKFENIIKHLKHLFV